MILIEQTIDKFGYNPTIVKTKTHRVIAQCDCCGVVRELRWCDVRRQPAYSCQPCAAQAQVVKLASPLVKEKRRQTFLKKFGVSSPGAIPGIQDKIKEANLRKYGVEHISQSKDFQAKKIISNLKNYGVEHFVQTVDFKTKSKNTCNSRYGVENAMQSEAVKDRLKSNLLDYYGVDNVFKSEEIKDKIKKVNLVKYGVENVASCKKIYDKIVATNILRYGFPNPIQNRDIYLKAVATLERRYGKTSLFSFYGKTEKEIRDWLNGLGFNFRPNRTVLNGLELDMYDKEHKFAIEYCGLYWHSEASTKPKSSNYHYNKYKLCKEKGIRLLTIFEDEWLYRNSQVRNFIKSALCANTCILMARKCKINLISNADARKYIDLWHIQGSTNTIKLAAALTFNNEVVGVMSFGRHPRDNSIVVLDRLCFKDNTSISGGASRLFSFLLKESKLEKIISWSDNRWSYGNVYSSLNFKAAKELKPDYSYYDKSKSIRVSKQRQKKSNTGCSKNVTEATWSKQHNLYRIFDCGKIRWEYSKPRNI
jgi:hypothetical protein